MKNPKEVLRSVHNRLEKLCIKDVQLWEDLAELEELLVCAYKIINKYPVAVYTEKERNSQQFLSASFSLTEFLQDRPHFFDSVKDQAKSMLEDNPSDLLTNREKEILKLIVRGLSMKGVAEELKISHHTAGTHRKNLFKKTKVNKTSELIHFALKNGLD